LPFSEKTQAFKQDVGPLFYSRHEKTETFRLPVAAYGSRNTTVVPLSEYSLMIIFGTFALLFVARQVNFYKIVMILKHFIQNTRKLHFENRLKLRTGFRGYRDSELEKSG
jgi:hypothetical protein